MMLRPTLFVLFFVAFVLPLCAQNPPVIRRSYQPSRDFLNSQEEKCYKMTMDEANRAFSRGYWNDAGKLYRAAKNCTDADQKARSLINEKIEACRKSAEDELLAEQQKAVRQARQQEASNRANDAERLLRRFDRAKAFRLADFANEYIAPKNKDNPDCVQVMLDAWNYDPRIHSGHVSETDDLQVPFGYEMAYNLGDRVQVRFGIVDSEPRMYAFAPQIRTLYSWVLPDFKPRKPQSVDSTLMGFELSPDGVTRVFYTEQTITLWRSARSIFNIDLAKVSLFCFDQKGEWFYYLNPVEEVVYAVNVADVFTPRNTKSKGGKARAQSSQKVIASGVGRNIKALAAANGEIWLGYPNRVVVQDDKGQERAVLQLKDTLQITYPNQPIYVRLFPADGLACYSTDELTLLLQREITSSVLQLKRDFDGIPLGYSPSGSLLAFQTQNSFQSDKRLAIWPSKQNELHYGSNLEDEDAFQSLCGAFALPPNNGSQPNWFAAVNSAGILKIWDLSPQNSVIGRGKFGKALALQATGDQIGYYQEGTIRLTQNEASKVVQIKPPTAIRSDGRPELTLSANGWAAITRTDMDSIALFQSANPNQIYYLPLPYSSAVVAFDPMGKYFAHTLDQDSVAVFRLDTPTPQYVQGTRFGISVGTIAFLAQENALVIQGSPMGEGQAESQSIPKIWSFQGTRPNLRPIRLENYYANLILSNPAGDEIVLSNGNDARIFKTDDLIDEAGAIRERAHKWIGAITYHPDGQTLAVGYSDGTIAFCDAHTGKELFQLSTLPGKTDTLGIIAIAYADSTRRIRVINLNGSVRTYDIDPNLMRQLVEGNGRQLVAFSPNQIGQWELEKALDYDKNLQKLLDSKDAPLIRSFFEFFIQQTRQSNNLSQMKGYIERAFLLYNKLDDKTQLVQKEQLLDAYNLYLMKLILRNKVAEAEQVVKQLEQLFKDEPIQLLKFKGHAALLRNNLQSAAKYYTSWYIRIQQDGNLGLYTDDPYRLQADLSQMNDYGLLNLTQRNVVARLFKSVYGFPPAFLKGTIVERTASAPTSFLLENFDDLPIDEETRLRWQVFNAQQNVPSYGAPFITKVQYLEGVLAIANRLKAVNPDAGTIAYQTTTIRIADTYKAWGEFEQGKPLTQVHYLEAIRLLTAGGSYAGKLERERLDTLANLYLQGGNILLSRKPDSALIWYTEGLKVAKTLQKRYEVPIEISASANRTKAPLLTQIGKAHLLLGNAEDAAAFFAQADSALTKGLNTLYEGHTALLQGDETEALLLYDGIGTSDQLALALSEIYQMADRMPAKADYLRAFALRLKNRYSKKLWFDAPSVNYLFEKKMTLYSDDIRKWKAGIAHSQAAQLIAETTFNQLPKDSDEIEFWKERYLEATLTAAYYTLFSQPSDADLIKKAIQQSLKATDAAKNYYSYAELFNTNIAHGYLLLGDTTNAIKYYQLYLNEAGTGANSPWEVLEKDWRDLRDAGIVLPGLGDVMGKIRVR